MTLKLSKFDPTTLLKTEKARTAFMAEAFASGDAGFIADAVGIVARAKGMREIAKATGLSREQLYRSFSRKGNPTLKTTLEVLSALDVQLSTINVKRKRA